MLVPSGSERIEVTVAIPVKERREQMLRCLDSLLRQDHPSYEILIIDDDSRDGTAEACRQVAARATVPIRVEVVADTLGARRNYAARLARGDLIAYTDSDCVADTKWLSTAAKVFSEQPEVGVICGMTVPSEPVTQGWPATVEITNWTGRFETCNVVFRSCALLESDGFYEEIGYGWEDTAAGYAVLRNGWKARFVPDAIVHHDVTYPGFVWHLRRAMTHKNLGTVIAAYPEIVSDLLWARTFLSRRHATFVAWIAGLLLARRQPLALALCVPYLRERATLWRDPTALLQHVIHDAAMVLSVAWGTPRARRILL
jgi:glycosyltransferase involved in cell wall biosynthesis